MSMSSIVSKCNAICSICSIDVGVTYFIAKSLDAGSAIRQDIWRFDRETCFVYAHATASFARILYYVTHTTLQSLSFAVWYTFAIAALTTLLASCTIQHWRGFWTFWLTTRATCLLFTRCILSFATFYTSCHILAILATWRIFITTYGPLISP